MIFSSVSPLARIWIVLFSAMTFSVAQFHRAAGGIISPVLTEELELTPTALGGVIGAMFIATVIMQVPAGIALDRYGVRRVVPLSLAVSGFGSLLFSQADDVQWLLAARIMLGVGFASLTAGAYLLFTRWYPQDRFATLSGLMVAIGGIGGLTGTYPLAEAIGLFGWRANFAAVGLLILAVSLLGYLTIRDAPPEYRESQARPSSIKETLYGYREIFGNRDFYKILALGLVTFAPITAIAGLWGGPYFQEIHGLTRTQTGMILFALFLSTSVAGLVVGPLDRRFGTRKGVILGCACLSFCSLSLLAIWPQVPLVAAIACLVLMTFCQQFYLPLAAHNRSLFGDHFVGRASTLLTLVSVAGIPLMQSGFGIVLEISNRNGLSNEQGYRLGFASIAAALLLASLIYATAKDMKPLKSDRS
ncbi:MFS transporter [Pelagibius sp. Alg239-R121]|uniref:MFS transporter n=1 Tax=Pelagibius sp. Alg239-R121 TaxID=2993448 RepID=UPI0024A76709|nr:MFS transporter [Pelagibius sp. Alg239-R121]